MDFFDFVDSDSRQDAYSLRDRRHFLLFFLSERTQARGKRKESIKGESRARGARQVPIVLIALFLSRGTHPSHTFHAHLALTSTMSPFLRRFFTSE